MSFATVIVSFTLVIVSFAISIVSLSSIILTTVQFDQSIIQKKALTQAIQCSSECFIHS